jgi:L-seryl-tRNA(Ser) seleniumtransferase
LSLGSRKRNHPNAGDFTKSLDVAGMSVAATLGGLLPPVHGLLQRPALIAAGAAHGRASLLMAIQTAVSELRDAILVHDLPPPSNRDAAAQQIETRALTWLKQRVGPSLQPVFNLTGTVLHTNLGRAPLADEAIEAIRAIAGACNVEYALDAGVRGERDEHVAGLLRSLTGAQDALVVNNNAAAVLLALNSLANRREVIVSRGELIEIGGAFRMPDVMARAGCKLVEVGTTNRTHVADYEAAIGPRTAAVMKVHPSNYAITGFTAVAQESAIAALAHRHHLPFIVDLGSGTLADLAQFGLPQEPTPQYVLSQGADLVTFSGDKLLGGPQAGLIVGREDLTQKLQRNPLKRALRVDKIILAALAATLRLYLNPDRLIERLPSLRLLARGENAIRAVADRVLQPVSDALGATAQVRVEPCLSQIGSGSLPVDRLRSWALVCAAAGTKRGGEARLNRLVGAFRALPVPVIGRLQDGALLFDLRCLEDEAVFLAQLQQLNVANPR